MGGEAMAGEHGAVRKSSQELVSDGGPWWGKRLDDNGARLGSRERSSSKEYPDPRFPRKEFKSPLDKELEFSLAIVPELPLNMELEPSLGMELKFPLDMELE